MQVVVDRLRAARPGGLATAAAYVLLGAGLLVSRLGGLNQSLWFDEIVTVRDFVRPGPREILAGPYIPNNHELFSMLAWGTRAVFGESETALRLWSALPFVAGALLVTAWLHVRVRPLSGVLFLLLCTASPLLLDITRQARGYGLAFLAMAVMTVAALEADRTRRVSLLAVAVVGGVAGTWTLPHFGIAFLATAAVLFGVRELRGATAFLLAPATLAIAAWYAPHLGDLLQGSRQDYAAPIETRWLLTAPIDQVLLPALIWIDGTALVSGLVWVPVIAVVTLVLTASPLLRELRGALILVSGTIMTVLVLWATRVDVAPRFFSYLLVPLLMLLASGAASILARLESRPPPVRTLAAGGVVVGSVLAFAVAAPDVLRLPREAHRDAAEAIRQGAASATVYAYMTRPAALEFYLGRRVIRPAGPEDPVVCERRERVALVIQPWVLPPAAFPCLERSGAQHVRFEQYARGGEIAVWLIPPE